ncbi:hypothetical protein M433DRAFT_134356 [Acidomyces richmondensis BFW]|nr:hypothetical protein M433DRAFT_134356 [Acidomyces richmondensis BFW]
MRMFLRKLPRKFHTATPYSNQFFSTASATHSDAKLGHATHDLFAHTKYAVFHGASCADFNEVPSQMLEKWCWDARTLQMISYHRLVYAMNLYDSVFEHEPLRMEQDRCLDEESWKKYFPLVMPRNGHSQTFLTTHRYERINAFSDHSFLDKPTELALDALLLTTMLMHGDTLKLHDQYPDFECACCSTDMPFQ